MKMTSQSTPYRKYLYVLAPESPKSDTDSTETIYSMQDRETEYVRDESDTCTKSETSEYTVYSFKSETNPFLDTESSDDIIKTEHIIVETRNVQFSSSPNSNNTSSNKSHENVEGDEDDSHTTSDDSELGQADYWNCIQCLKSNNHPKYRYCMKCFRLRKEFFPPPPKGTKKRHLTLNKQTPNNTNSNIIINHKRKHSTDSEIEINGDHLKSKTLKLDETLFKSNKIISNSDDAMDVTTNSEHLSKHNTSVLGKPNIKSSDDINNKIITNVLLKPNETLEKPINTIKTTDISDKLLDDSKTHINIDIPRTTNEIFDNTKQIGTLLSEQVKNITRSNETFDKTNSKMESTSCKENIKTTFEYNVKMDTITSTVVHESINQNRNNTNDLEATGSSEKHKSISNMKIEENNLTTLANIACKELNNIRKAVDDDKIDVFVNQSNVIGNSMNKINNQICDTFVNSSSKQTSITPSIRNQINISTPDVNRIKMMTDSDSSDHFKKPISSNPQSNNNSPFNSTSSICSVLNKFDIDSNLGQLKKLTPTNDVNLKSTLHLETPKTSRTFQELCEEVEKRQSITNSSQTSGGGDGHGSGSSYVEQDSGFLSGTSPNVCIMCERGPKNAGFIHTYEVHVCSCYSCAVKAWKKTKKCPICNLRACKVMKVIIS